MAAAATAVRTLIVEDDSDTAEAISRVMEAEGLEPEVATSAGQALVKLEMGPPPGLVLLDLGLPDADGALVLWRIRRSAWRTRVAVVTGRSDAASDPALLHYQPDRVFTKPLDLMELVEWVRSIS